MADVALSVANGQTAGRSIVRHSLGAISAENDKLQALVEVLADAAKQRAEKLERIAALPHIDAIAATNSLEPLAKHNGRVSVVDVQSVESMNPRLSRIGNAAITSQLAMPSQ